MKQAGHLRDRELLQKLAFLRAEILKAKRNGQTTLKGKLSKEWLEKIKKSIDAKPSGAPEEKNLGDLEKIETEVQTCRKCPLAESRINTVFGVGNKNARLMFVGEAPGAEEDKRGEPFVGRAGKLLTDMIKAMGFSRDDVYIANIIKCRPPGNRDPLPSEIEQCEGYLKRQIAKINPEVICALGKHAAHTLLRVDSPISKLRGNFYEYENRPLMPTYHPAYLLRNSAGKADVWRDLQAILKKLDMPLPDGK